MWRKMAGNGPTRIRRAESGLSLVCLAILKIGIELGNWQCGLSHRLLSLSSVAKCNKQDFNFDKFILSRVCPRTLGTDLVLGFASTGYCSQGGG